MVKGASFSIDPAAAWKDGLPLFQALFKFGDDKTSVRLHEALTNPTNPGIIEALTKAAQAGAGWEAFGTPQVRDAQDFAYETAKLRKTLEQSVLDQLFSGALLGYGYAVPRHPTDTPALIPKDVWRGRIKWEDSSVKGNGLEFLVVRALPRKSPKLEKIEVRKPGRPTRKPQIIEAFRALEAEGKIKRENSLTSHYPLVRNKVAALFPDEQDTKRGLGDKALYQHLAPLFGEE